MNIIVSFPPELNFISSILIYTLLFLSVRHKVREGRPLFDFSKGNKILVMFFGLSLLDNLLYFVFDARHLIHITQSILGWVLFLATILYFPVYLIKYGLRSPEVTRNMEE